MACVPLTINSMPDRDKMSDETPELTAGIFQRATVYGVNKSLRLGRQLFHARFSLRIASKRGPLHVCPKLFQPLWRVRLRNRLQVARTAKARVRAVRDAGERPSPP